MDFITRAGLEKTRFTALAMAFIVAVGASSYLSLPKREDPEITVRTALVQAQFKGMSPERVENLIAIPIERKIREIGEVEDIETSISAGQALIYVHLYDRIGADGIASAWEDLRNKMNEVVAELPAGADTPRVNTDYGDVSIATIAVTGDGFSLAEIEDAADALRKAMYRIDGVSKVNLFGVQDERIWLEVDTKRLATVGVQIQQVLDDLRDQNVIQPAGEIDAEGTQIILEANGDLATVDEIRNLLTQVSGLAGYIRLSDLMTVRRGYVDPKQKPVFYNGEPAIVLAVEMASGSDIQSLGVRLAKAIRAHEATQPIGIAYNISTFQETNVTQSVNSALENVGQTFLVVLIVMLLFLGARAAVIVACIVPFTICFTLVSMTLLGIDIEKVSIAAVIISLGLLVDNGLVVVEDIEGRVKSGEPVREAALAAGKQYVVPLGVASITTVSAFMPMLFIDGNEGEFAYSLGAVVASMLLGSWITALYILPYLCVLILKAKKVHVDPIHSNGLIERYGGVTRRLLPFGIPIVIAVYAAVVVSGSSFGFIKSEFFPFSERADFLVYMDMPKGTAISGTEQVALRVQRWLNDKSINPNVVNSTAYIGDGGPRFNLGLDPAEPDPSSAFFAVNTTDLSSAIETANRSRRHFIEQFPEARFRVTRLPQGGSESGVVDIEISGPDALVLLDAARRVEANFDELPAVVKNETDWGNRVAKIVVDIAQDKARELDVTSAGISEIMDAYFSGTTYSTFREDDNQIPIVLRASPSSRNSLEDLANLSVASGDQIISVDQVASFQPKLEYSEIRRENQVRQVIVSAKSATLSAQQTFASIEPTLEKLELGPEYRVNIGGEIENSTNVTSQMGANMPLALGVMLAALVFQFNSIRRSLATFLTIPLIVIGAPYALLTMGHPFSFFALLGLMSLMGIIINNAIVLINQIDIERETQMLDDAIIAAAKKRARPIVLTSLTTICGLIPMALSGGALFEPMAAVMIGGLLVGSPITLIFVPALCRLLMKDRGERITVQSAS